MPFDIVIGRNEKDRQKYGKKGTILIGKSYIQMGRTTSLSNPLYMDVTTSHVVFICGKRGGGKCLHGDTTILLDDGSLGKISDLENDNKGVMALNDQMKMQQANKSAFYKRKVSKLLEIKLRSGKKIKLTPEHPLLTVKGWMPAEQLPIGSRIATPRKLDCFGDSYLSEEEVKLIAYFITEGHLGNGFVLFSNADKKIVDDFSCAVQSFDNSLQIKTHSKEGCFRVIGSEKREVVADKRDNEGKFVKGVSFSGKTTLRNWLGKIKIYDQKAHEKKLPKEIFTLTKEKTRTLLNRMFSCDGSIFKEGISWKISYGSSSKTLIQQVSHLLLKFGIVSKYRKKKTRVRDTYELEIKGEQVSNYLQEIGFFGEKEKKVEKALAETPRIIRNPNVDTIPKEVWELYKPNNWAEIGRKLHYSHPKALRESVRYSPSRQKLLQIAKADESELLEQFATSDIFWDEIVKIEMLEGNFEVYDITVPKHHNFVANDIIVHNSYTMGVIAEGLTSLEEDIKNNISIIMLDTMGVYWTMKYPNHRDEELLKQWGLEGKGQDIKIYTPGGFYHKYKREGIPTDAPFSLKPSELSPEDWFLTFEISQNEPLGVFIEKTILRLQTEMDEYDIDDIIAAIKADKSEEQTVKNAAENRFSGTKNWGLFDKEGTPIRELAQGGQVTVLDVSCYATMPGGWKIKSLVVGIISQKLFIQRMLAKKTEEYGEVTSAVHYLTKEGPKKKKMPMVWLVIDEAHEFLPVKGKTAASDALVTILREGRQPGISLILATQQPGKIHTDVMTQSDIILSHRITAKLDTDALGMLMQSYMRDGLDKMLNGLPRVKGSAIILDDSNERMYPIRIRPRFTWHGGQSPTAIPEKKDVYKF